MMTQVDSSLVVTAIPTSGEVVPSTTSTTWWTGVPTRLLRKTTLVSGEDDAGNRLPVHTLTFAMPPHDAPAFHSKARHPSTLRLDRGDVMKMVIPQYKPKSYSISALRQDEFDITVKIYPQGRASGCLDRLRINDVIHAFGKSKGNVRNCDDSSATTIITHVGVIAYGVGITEALPIVTAELALADDQDNDHPPEPADENNNDDNKKKNTTQTKVTLLWAARTRADTFWHDEIALLQTKYPATFCIQYIFSRDEHDTDSLKGRIDANVLRQVFIDYKWPTTTDNDDAAVVAPGVVEPRFISVGTKEMMADTDEMLSAIGYPMPQYALLKKKK
jgi:ferredoxin-NADP reductase